MKIAPAKRVEARANHFTSHQQAEIKALENEGKEVINLGRGNPDLPTFQKIVEQLQESVTLVKNQGYPPYGGEESLKKAIIDFYKSEFNVSLDADEVTIFSGSLAALTALPMSLANPGDVVLTPNPAFFGYDAGIKMSGAENYPLNLSPQNDYLPEYQTIPQKKLEKAKLLFLNYPHNPTGAGATRDFFEETVAFAKANNIVVAHDFAYSDISFNQTSPSFLQAKGAKEVGIEIYTLSKTFNMAGWRIAFAVGNRDVIALLKSYIRASVGGTFGAVQDAAILALNDSTQERQELRNIYQERKEVAYSLLTKAGLDVVDSSGTFFLWIKLPEEFGKSDVDFVENLLTQKQLALIPGSTFGDAGKGYIRLSLVSDTKVIAEGVRRLIDFVQKR